MCGRWIVAAALLAPVALAGQETGVLRVTVSLVDSNGQPTPVVRHALLISDSPVTTVPKLVRTAADGTLEVTLAPGSYMVESDRAVLFQGKAYEWFQLVVVSAGREVTLELTTSNAEVTAPGPLSDASTALRDADPIVRSGQWQSSVVSVWSPTSRASGFVVDARGLMATHRHVVGSATTVAVQLSEAVKVPARVVSADVSGDVAILWVSPDATSGLPPVPLECPPAQAPSVAEGDEVATLAIERGRMADIVRGRVTALRPHAVETDLGLPFGGAGGPVFDDAGGVVGLSTMRIESGKRWQDTEIVRTATVCDALAAARSGLASATPPEPTRLPVEPAHPFPASALADAEAPAGSPVPPDVVTSKHFEIAFITPMAIAQAGQKAGWTGGRTGRAPEIEARLGRLTDFGTWSDYFYGAPAVVVVRVTPRMVEGFWKRVAREAARTQGAELPPFKRFTTSFDGMTLSCGAKTIAPIQPFVLDHQLSATDAVREGLYVFDPNAFDPGCGEVRLTLQSEEAPGTPDTIVIPPSTIARIWSDFAAWRDARVPA